MKITGYPNPSNPSWGFLYLFQAYLRHGGAQGDHPRLGRVEGILHEQVAQRRIFEWNGEQSGKS